MPKSMKKCIKKMTDFLMVFSIENVMKMDARGIQMDTKWSPKSMNLGDISPPPPGKGLGRVLGRLLGGFRKDLGGFCRDFGRILNEIEAGLRFNFQWFSD